MSKQRVEVRLGSEMQDLMEVGVVYVREHAQKLPVDMLHRRGERLREVVT